MKDSQNSFLILRLTVPWHYRCSLIAFFLLFLTSCSTIIPNKLVYQKPGIVAVCLLSGGQVLASLETLADSCAFPGCRIIYDEIDGKASAWSCVNLRFGGESINLADVKYEAIEGIILDASWRKMTEKYINIYNEVHYRVVFHFYGEEGGKDVLASVHFDFDKDKNIAWIACGCINNLDSREHITR